MLGRPERGLSEGVNVFPGAIVSLPLAHSGLAYGLPFAAIGGFAICADDRGATPNYVGTALALTGPLHSAHLEVVRQLRHELTSPGPQLRVHMLHLW